MTEEIAKPLRTKKRHDGWRRLRRNRVAMIALWFLGVLVVLGVAVPLFLNPALKETSEAVYVPPSGAHWFGTDINGKDLFYRVLAGARVSIAVGLAGALISLFVGTAYGLVAGFLGGKVDAIMMRLVDVLYSIPRVLFVLIFINAFDAFLYDWMDARRLAFEAAGSEGLANFLGNVLPYRKIVILIVSLGLIEWLTMARIVRGQVLSLKEQQYVLAARSMGQGKVAIMRKHLLPNLWTVILTYLTLTIPTVILDESFLSFLGLGIDDPAASWGSLLKDGAGPAINAVKSRWWPLLFPATFMAATLLALNFLGDGLRDAFDPRSRD
jgi:oligopeptide transport system permease protein